jgi:rhodanese-related sulfurtransferase
MNSINAVKKAVDVIEDEEEKKIIVYCKAGVRSEKAIEIFKMLNNNIKYYNLVGGITDWKKNGFEITKDHE